MRFQSPAAEAAALTARAEARRAEVAARILTLRADIARLERARRPGPRARFRVVVWSLAIVGLFSAMRPGGGLLGGPEVRAGGPGAGSAGGVRFEVGDERARVRPGDVVAAAPGGALDLRLRAGGLVVRDGGRVLVERLGPPSLRVLRAPVTVAGPLALATPQGWLEVPAGTVVEVEPGGRFRADGPGASLRDASGLHPVAP